MVRLPSGMGAPRGTTRPSLFLWWMAYGFGLWLGGTLGIMHQWTPDQAVDFLTTIYGGASHPWIHAVFMAFFWFAVICFLGHTSGGQWLLLCVIILKSALSGCAFSLIFANHFILDGLDSMAVFLVDTFLFWSGAFGLMGYTLIHRNEASRKTLGSYLLFLTYFICSSCFKLWSLQLL